MNTSTIGSTRSNGSEKHYDVLTHPDTLKTPHPNLLEKTSSSTTVGVNPGSTFNGGPTTGGGQGAMYLQTFPLPNDSNGNSASFSYFTPNTQSAPIPYKLYGKIHKIIKDGIRVGKNGRNDFHKYDYVTEADVVDEMKRIFTENNIVYDFNIIGTRKVEGLENVTEVEAEITLIDLDNSESKVYTFFGQGQDKGDKGIYKAYTGLQKYFFMKNFLISTGDDPENDTGVANKVKEKTTTTTPAKRGFTPPPRQAAAPIATPNAGTPGVSSGVLIGKTDEKGGTSGTVSVSNEPPVQGTAVASNPPAALGTIGTTNSGTNENVVITPNAEAAPTVKKPRGHFNPPKRAPKAVKEE